MKIIEGICYLHPHKKELVASHPSMKGTWRTCMRLVKDGSMMAPLLVDDIRREESFAYQTIDEILLTTIGKKYDSIPWLGNSIIESEIYKQYGNLGCKMFDSIYHREVLLMISSLSTEWEWIVVHPVIFKEQQAGMLLNLYKFIYKNINISFLAQKEVKKVDEIRDDLRNKFLDKFTHYWIDVDGNIESITNPIYNQGKIQHICLNQ